MKKLRSKAGYQNEYLVLAVLAGLLLAVFGRFLGKWGALIGLGLVGVLIILGTIYDPKTIAKQAKENGNSEEENK